MVEQIIIYSVDEKTERKILLSVKFGATSQCEMVITITECSKKNIQTKFFFK